MKKIIYGMAVALSFSSAVNAATDQGYGQGQGQVNFKGVVIDAPCGIDPDSADQTIDFGQISKTHLNKPGISAKKNVDIKLVNCTLEKASKYVTITFSGSSLGDGSELGTSGGTGTAIRMSTAAGELVKFDGTTAAGKYNLKDGDNTMRYSAWVEKASTNTGDVTEGEFAAVANFNLAYQ
ncbi:type 1 fimbrial protein [Escherichia coli]|nr:type 1 fimbrial protein [Escherichia coli]ELZ4661747.1 type 1 fimbrial protein [Escherichia coli]MCN8164017.1 type 1 fimbrial protein [Escherichia coli]MCO0407008.1 type 1 fimbrial protein [Escherichia coli]